MDKHYSQLIIFYYVAHFMSFTKAANHLHCSKAYVSQQMRELEREIATVLFHRNTRMVKLTLSGESIFEHAALIVREFQYAEHTIASLQNKAQGLLRVTTPSAYADCVLAPNLPRFFRQYPQIKLEMNFTSSLVNLVDQKIDVAIRLTHEPPLERVAKKISVYQEVICASTQYLKRVGEPLHPKELLNHECLVYTYDKSIGSWPFLVDSEIKTINVNRKLAANSYKVLLEAALSGLGIARLPTYVVNEYIKHKKLKKILTKYYPMTIPIYAIYAQSRVIPQKIRVFLKFMQELHQSD